MPGNEHTSPAIWSRCACALLALPAAEADRPHRREALAALLWPEHPTSAALANLRHTLSNLRNAIGDATAAPPFLLAWLGLARVALAEGNLPLAQAYLQQAFGAKGAPAWVHAEIVEAMAAVQDAGREFAPPHYFEKG